MQERRMSSRAQINTDPETYAALARLAAELGYTQVSGPRVGEGSPVKFLAALMEADRLAPEDERALFRKMLRGYLGWTGGKE
jgi:hypothetical protein